MEGRLITLEPLAREHEPDVWHAASDPRIWELAHGPRTLEEMHVYVREALAADTLPFLIRERSTGRVVGTTRLKRIDEEAKTCELGNTWLVPELWRTGANRESKLLLLTKAFEEMGMVRVELRAGAQNWRSRQALLALGAVEEGTLRSAQCLPGGARRDLVVYSVLASEWPAVKEGLMGRPRA